MGLRIFWAVAGLGIPLGGVALAEWLRTNFAQFPPAPHFDLAEYIRLNVASESLKMHLRDFRVVELHSALSGACGGYQATTALYAASILGAIIALLNIIVDRAASALARDHAENGAIRLAVPPWLAILLLLFFFLIKLLAVLAPFAIVAYGFCVHGSIVRQEIFYGPIIMILFWALMLALPFVGACAYVVRWLLGGR